MEIAWWGILAVFFGGLIFFFGAKIKVFIDRYFNILSIVFVILLVSGFIVIKLLLGD